MKTSDNIIESLNQYRDTKKDIKSLEKFFKVFPGGYGEGDKFIGVSVPNQRKVSLIYFNEASLEDIQNLLNSKVHEHRLTALFILVKQYQKAKKYEDREKMAKLYLNNIDRVNGWDLVDPSAHFIVGPYVYETGKIEILYNLAQSDHLWKQRVSVIATFYFIRKGIYEHSLKIAEILVDHKHDLIHKAVGWMLREVGNKSLKDELPFLDKYAANMPRTMLRYAIEKFEPELRERYLKMGRKAK
jgi:3-methyladenine DNA glycosylase AlkD